MPKPWVDGARVIQMGGLLSCISWNKVDKTWGGFNILPQYQGPVKTSFISIKLKHVSVSFNVHGQSFAQVWLEKQIKFLCTLLCLTVYFYLFILFMPLLFIARHGVLQINRSLHGLKQKGNPVNKMKILWQVKYRDILCQTFQRYVIRYWQVEYHWRMKLRKIVDHTREQKFINWPFSAATSYTTG